MTPEQKAAYVVAQAALLNARLTVMNAENESHGWFYNTREEYRDVLKDFEARIGHNALVELFKE